MSTLERALSIATEAHAGQTDKAGAPYLAHVLRVVYASPAGDAAIVAMLHDVVEDSPWTIEQLAAEGFSPDIVEAVDAMTRREGEDYFDFVGRAAANPLARIVKRADLLDNMDRTRLKREPTERDQERLAKYRVALAIVEGVEA